MSSLPPFDKPLPYVSPDADEQRVVLGHLAILRDQGEITDADFTDIGQALGLIGSDVDDRPKRGHLRGDRLRAVPVDYKARGAEAS